MVYVKLQQEICGYRDIHSVLVFCGVWLCVRCPVIWQLQRACCSAPALWPGSALLPLHPPLPHQLLQAAAMFPALLRHAGRPPRRWYVTDRSIRKQAASRGNAKETKSISQSALKPLLLTAFFSFPRYSFVFLTLSSAALLLSIESSSFLFLLISYHIFLCVSMCPGVYCMYTVCILYGCCLVPVWCLSGACLEFVSSFFLNPAWIRHLMISVKKEIAFYPTESNAPIYIYQQVWHVYGHMGRKDSVVMLWLAAIVCLCSESLLQKTK